MVPRRAEGVFLHEPAGREDDEVGDCGTGAMGMTGRGKYGEDGWVRVVVGDAANGVEAAEIVLVRIVEAVPGDDVEGCVGLRGGEERPTKLAENGPGRVGVVFGEGSEGGLEVAGVGEAVGADGTEFGEGEVALVELEDVTADGLVGVEVDSVANAAGNDADFIGADQEVAQLCLNVQGAVLRHDQEVAVGGVEGCLFRHVLAGCVDVDAYALLHRWISSTCH